MMRIRTSQITISHNFEVPILPTPDKDGMAFIKFSD